MVDEEKADKLFAWKSCGSNDIKYLCRLHDDASIGPETFVVGEGWVFNAIVYDFWRGGELNTTNQISEEDCQKIIDQWERNSDK